MDQLTETTEVSLDYEPELLYKNMVAAKAQWLYELEEWNDIITPERQKELYKEEKRSGTIVKEKKIGRNDPVHVVQERNIKSAAEKSENI